MSFLGDANRLLLSRIFSIYPELKKVKKNTFGNEDVSSPTFTVGISSATETSLPASFSSSSQAASSSQTSSSELTIDSGDYAYNSAMAMLRVTQILDKVVNAGIAWAATGKLAKEIMDETMRGQIITRCFAYLDYQYVPKIVDEGSYRLVLALKEYFSTLMNNSDKILDYTVIEHITFVRDLVQKGLEGLQPMLTIMDARIEAYEVNIKDFDRKLAMYRLQEEPRLVSMYIEGIKQEVDSYAMTGKESIAELEDKAGKLRQLAEDLSPDQGAVYLEFRQRQERYKTTVEEAIAAGFSEEVQTNYGLYNLMKIMTYSVSSSEKRDKSLNFYNTLVNEGLMTRERLTLVIDENASEAGEARGLFRQSSVRDAKLLPERVDMEQCIEDGRRAFNQLIMRVDTLLNQVGSKLPHVADKSHLPGPEFDEAVEHEGKHHWNSSNTRLSVFAETPRAASSYSAPSSMTITSCS